MRQKNVWAFTFKKAFKRQKEDTPGEPTAARAAVNALESGTASEKPSLLSLT